MQEDSMGNFSRVPSHGSIQRLTKSYLETRKKYEKAICCKIKTDFAFLPVWKKRKRKKLAV